MHHFDVSDALALVSGSSRDETALTTAERNRFGALIGLWPDGSSLTLSGTAPPRAADDLGRPTAV
jgi:hypothetical protein